MFTQEFHTRTSGPRTFAASALARLETSGHGYASLCSARRGPRERAVWRRPPKVKGSWGDEPNLSGKRTARRRASWKVRPELRWGRRRRGNTLRFWHRTEKGTSTREQGVAPRGAIHTAHRGRRGGDAGGHRGQIGG